MATPVETITWEEVPVAAGNTAPASESITWETVASTAPAETITWEPVAAAPTASTVADFQAAAARVPTTQKLAIPALQAAPNLASGILDLGRAVSDYIGLPRGEDYEAQRAILKDKSAQSTTPEYQAMTEKLGALPTGQGLVQRTANPSILAGEALGQYPQLIAGAATMGATAPLIAGIGGKGIAGAVARGAARYIAGSAGGAPVSAPFEAGAAVDEAKRRGVEANPGDILASAAGSMALEGVGDTFMPGTWKTIGSMVRGGKAIAKAEGKALAKTAMREMLDAGMTMPLVKKNLTIAGKSLAELGLSAAGNGFEEWAQTITEEAPANIAEGKSLVQPETMERARQSVAPGAALGAVLGGGGTAVQAAADMATATSDSRDGRLATIRYAETFTKPNPSPVGPRRIPVIPNPSALPQAQLLAAISAAEKATQQPQNGAITPEAIPTPAPENITWDSAPADARVQEMEAILTADAAAQVPAASPAETPPVGGEASIAPPRLAEPAIPEKIGEPDQAQNLHRRNKVQEAIDKGLATPAQLRAMDDRQIRDLLYPAGIEDERYSVPTPDYAAEMPRAKNEVSGFQVRAHVPNTSSISATFEDSDELPGVREVPMRFFDAPPERTKRTEELARQIKESGEINPLIVAIDDKGPWILEGGHRYDALKILGVESFPAVVVIERASIAPDPAVQRILDQRTSPARQAQRERNTAAVSPEIEQAQRMAEQQRESGDTYAAALDRFERAFGANAAPETKRAWETALAGRALGLGPQRASVSTEAPAAPTVTEDQIRTVFPTATIEPAGEGFGVSFPEHNNLFVLVQPSGKITLGPGGARSLAQQGVGPGANVKAAVTLGDSEVLMRLVDAGEMPHEASHVAIEYFATPAEQIKLREDFADNYEDMAKDYKAWFDGRQSRHASLWQRVKDFFARLAQGVGIQNRSGIYQSIASGKMMQREATGGERAVRPHRNDEAMPSEQKASLGPATDADYLAAVERGDTTTAYRLFTAAAKAAGFNKFRMWHGSAETFNKFEKSAAHGNAYFFSRDKDYAESMAEENGDGEPGVVSEFILKSENPMRATLPAHQFSDGQHERPLIAEAKAKGHDSLILTDEDGNFEFTIVFSPSQIKSADPATRDEQGNVIPLSERFNEKSDDIRYSLGPKKAAATTPEGGPKYAQNDEHDAHVVNLETFPPDMRDFVQQMTVNELRPSERRSWTTRPHAEVLAKAKEILASAPAYEKLVNRNTTAAVKDEQLTALAILYANSILRAKAAHDAAALAPTEENKSAALLAHVEAAAVHSKLIGARSEAGRALGSIRMARQAIIKGGGVPAINQALSDRGISLTPEEMSALIALPSGDMRAYLMFMRDAIRKREKHSWKDYITAYRMFNMLFNTSTQSANLVSNFMKTTLDVIPDTLEAAFAKDKKLADVWTYYVALIKALPTSGVSAAQTITRNVSDFELSKGIYNGVAGEQAASEFKGGGFNPINLGMRITRAGDVLFSDAHYIAMTEVLASRAGRKKGLSGDALRAFVDTDKLSGKYHEEALEAAREKTFQEDSETLQKLSSGINAIPGARWILPFVKTPYNINAAAMRMIPGIGIGAALMQGKTMTRALAEQSIGIGFTLVGVALAAAGRATGAPPDDEGGKDKFFNAEKKETYSIKLGNQWVKYSRLGPLAMPILAGVAWNEYRERGGEDKNALSALGKMLGKVGKMVSDQSMLQGLNGLSKAVAEPDKYLESFMKGLVGQMVPAASLQRQITRGTEDEILEPDGLVEKLLADLPKTERNAILDLLGHKPLPQKVDSLGRPQTYRGGGWQALASWIKGAEDETDPVVRELLDLNVKYPSAVGKTITEEISAEQRAAKSARLGRDLTKSELKQSGELPRDAVIAKKTSVGQAVYNAVERTMNSAAYRGLTPVAKAAMLERVVASAKSKTGKRWNAEQGD